MLNSTPDSLFAFVKDNIYSNPSDLLMKYSGKDLGFNLSFAITQIKNRRKTIRKLPSFTSNDKFLFPDAISSEQATDEKVARFHASLVGSGKTIIDLTAGLGIDAFSISKAGNKVTATEIDPLKADALKYNSKLLGLKDFTVCNDDCINVIDSLSSSPDIFFIDPARRDNDNQRTYGFADCQPDISSFYEKLVSHGSTLFIKASPLLDIKNTLNIFKGIKEIYVVSLKGECKEILIEIGNEDVSSPILTALDLDSEGIRSRFSYNTDDENFIPHYANEEDIKINMFLYEPNASLIKLHAGGVITERFPKIKKIAPNTELFISTEHYQDFPGRVIKIDEILSSKKLKQLKKPAVSIVARNYPAKAEDLRKKLKASENPDKFLYAFRAGENNKPVIITGERITNYPR